MKNTWTTHCLFADDVRHELGNKLSLMGLYTGGDIIIEGRPPTLLPKIVVALFVLSDINSTPKKLEISIHVPPGKHELLKLSLENPEVKNSEDATRAMIFVAIPISPVPLTEEGDLEVVVKSGDVSKRSGRLKIRFKLPTVSTDGSPSK